MERNFKTRILAEGAIMVAMAFILSYIKIFHLPWGGSITLLSMLPIAIFSIKRGVKAGLFAAFVSALLQLGQGIAADGLLGWGLTPVMLVACIFFDYIGAYIVIGLAGIFRDKGIFGRLGGTAMAVLIRYLFHIVSGAVIFHSSGMIWEAFSTDNEWLYSTLYNGAYMLPEMIFTVIGAAVLLKVPQINRLIAES